ncbi:MAG TPA: glycosyltransferase family 2 protein [Anditalea sp.]|nr:glycosyltransferase family 2 protein [Anditalea sp.]
MNKIDQKLVTVLMPAYNVGKFLRESIDSILSQTYPDFNFLIINDGSTDNTEDIILSYDDPRINYIKNEKNIGYIASLNKGIDLISSKYIVRMDSDDIALSHRLEKQVEFMESRPDVAVCGSGKINFYSGKKGTETSVYTITNEKHLLFSSIFNTSIPHPSAILRNDILQKNGLRYDKDYYYAEDKAMWLDMSQYGALSNIEEPLVKYRIHLNQVSIKHNEIQRVNSITKSKLVLARYGVTIYDEELRPLRLLCYPQICEKVTDLFEVESLIEKLIDNLESQEMFDKQFVSTFLQDRLFTLVSRSTTLGLPLLNFINQSKFSKYNSFDYRFFIKTLLKRSTRGVAVEQ